MPGEYSTPWKILQLKFLGNERHSCVFIEGKSIIESNKQPFTSDLTRKKNKQCE